MPIRSVALLLPIAGGLLLGGCALAPLERPSPPDPLTPSAFEARMEGLEARLAAHCADQREALARHREEQLALTADVREVGYLLRGLEDDLDRLSDEPQRPATVADCPAEDERLANKTLVGRNEWVGLPDVGTFLEARIDSGANTSSLSATEITAFERDGEDWVRFKLGLNEDDAVIEAIRGRWIEAPVERRVRIVQATGEESRPVIRLLMSLGPIRENVEFTLSDRTHLDFPVLLGRRFLMDIAIIDVARRHVHPRPSFPTPPDADAEGEPETTDEAASPRSAG
ncbi:ATP-dependent zinc protease [Halomonas beimenensis]|nr:ATP-dependent zinc protease [Halomonas beimenensis]